MKKRSLLKIALTSKLIKVLILAFVFIPGAFSKDKLSKNKKEIVGSIERQKDRLIEISDKIWEAAETSLQEFKSSKYLSDYAEENGFTVERGVADIPTAFTATYGSGRPYIGIMGEYDANAGISQKRQPTKETRIKGGAGHGCGHNLFGTASLGAAIAIKELIEKGEISGTIIFFGTPAEETIFAKVWMVRAGLFDDLDVCMDWHPGDKTEASTQSSKALVDFRVKFYGNASHASADPWNGNSAVDAMELFTTGLNYYREHIKPTARIHYDIEKAGDVVNVVPEYAQIWTRLRENDKDDVDILYDRAKTIAEAAAMMANVTHEIDLISGIYEIQPNRTGAGILQKNLESLGDILYTDEEIKYANTILKEAGKPEKGIDGKINPLRETFPAQGGSTDVGDVSQVVPVISLSATATAKGGPWHSWAVVACTGMSIGHKGLVYASKALAMTMSDLYENPKLLESVKKDFLDNKGDKVYDPRIPSGPPRLID
jgi:aminobenzoyl-glutamate utilization protein B